MRDGSLQIVQDTLIRGLTAVTFAMDYLVKEKGDIVDNNLMEKIFDGVLLISKASHLLDLFRRQSFKSNIKEEQSSLCSDTYSVKGYYLVKMSR